MNPNVERACKAIIEAVNGLTLSEAVFLLAAMMTQLAVENECSEEDVVAAVRSTFKSKTLIDRSVMS
jgi:hypothetical protein